MGSWLKLDDDLPDKDEIVNIAAALDLEVREVWPPIVEMWMWANRNASATGRLPLNSLESFAKKFGRNASFWDHVTRVSWLGHDERGFFIPQFRKRFGPLARKRTLNAARQQAYRERHEEENSVTQGVTENVTLASRARYLRRKTKDEELRVREDVDVDVDVGALKEITTQEARACARDGAAASNGAAGSDAERDIDWARALSDANRWTRRLGAESAARLSAGDRSLLAKAAALAQLGHERRVADAIEATAAAYAKPPAKRPRVGRLGYLHGVLKSKFKDAAQDFDRQLARLRVPDDLFDHPSTLGQVLEGLKPKEAAS